MSDKKIAWGVISTANIGRWAVNPAIQTSSNGDLLAVASRDSAVAASFAEEWNIPRSYGSYMESLEDDDIDAVYIPLPNSLHCEWTLRALEAGKHVLCEKPMAANAEEAERMAEASEKAGRVLVEAFHWRYHPLASRMKQIVDGGELGEVRHVEASLCIPMLIPGDIRFRWDLAGGATMDTGCYTISMVRHLAGAEPEVVSAEARLSSPEVDRWMRADLRFPDGRSGRITCSLFSSTLLKIEARARGDAGEMRVFNPVAPHLYHRLSLRKPAGVARERVTGDATYTHQLRAFVEAVRGGAPMVTDARDAVANMRVIDAVYEKAGLKRRGT